MNDFVKAFLMTAGTMVFFSVASTLAWPAGGNVLLLLLWFIGPLVGIAALISSIISLRDDRQSTAAGLLAGLSVGSLALALTWTYNLREIEKAFYPVGVQRGDNPLAVLPARPASTVGSIWYPLTAVITQTSCHGCQRCPIGSGDVCSADSDPLTCPIRLTVYVADFNLVQEIGK